MARFAEGYCKDSGLPLCLSGPIAKEIERQVEEWRDRTAQLAAPTERLEVVRCVLQRVGGPAGQAA